jgi:hypothetical protein
LAGLTAMVGAGACELLVVVAQRVVPSDGKTERSKKIL